MGRVRSAFLVLSRERDHRHRRERTVSFSESEPERRERRVVPGPQEKQTPEVSAEGRIDLVEPLRNGPGPLQESPQAEVLPERIVPRLVADKKLDLGGRVRFENGQAGSDLARFLDKKSEVIARLDRSDSDCDPGAGVPIGQQPRDRFRLAPNPDPSASNRPRSAASQNPAALGGKLEAGFGTEETRDSLALLIVDFDLDRDAPVRVEVADRQLHRPPVPVHVVGEVKGRLLTGLCLQLDRLVGCSAGGLHRLDRSLSRRHGGQHQTDGQRTPEFSCVTGGMAFCQSDRSMVKAAA